LPELPFPLAASKSPLPETNAVLKKGPVAPQMKNRSLAAVAVAIAIAAIALPLAPARARGNGAEYVNGYVWANSRLVAACLVAVGARHTDELQYAQWDQWVACVALGSRRGRNR
jgi:hypothetical protein